MVKPPVARPSEALGREDRRERSAVEAGLFGWEDADGAEAALDAALGTLGKAVTLAIEPLYLRAKEYDMLRDRLPSVNYVSADPLIAPLRMEGNDETLQASAVMTIEPGLYEEGWECASRTMCFSPKAERNL